ncbi:hypothetical protein DFJ58DRAFT_837930 [Suillus subalutaceus]|uniref:uncharacterized protein n=1 Tax=Suillus subalutaceus TaxID=48586 RepID=UPI001B87CA7A|nr:uncharacterized protein DFJ58DRAFT_837930 [Suillus subalutaceus]KAG1868282.1 hypothetical protein DFJ58DRAFT_837930 [Suillus subalutaceus]
MLFFPFYASSFPHLLVLMRIAPMSLVILWIIHRLSTWWPFETRHASPAINVVDVPLAPSKLRYATAGAPGPDDDLIRDEDYVSPPPSPNPDSRQPSTAKVANAGEHGSGRLCFCL